MRFDEYRGHDSTGLADLVRSGEVTSAELVDVAIARAEEVDPALGALANRQFDDARARVRGTLAGPMAGVPFLLKDLYQAQAGIVETCGSRSLASSVPTETDTVVQRWLDAGVVVIGRTTVPEFGSKGVTEPDLHGPARNPWALDRSPGGSSGGAAAAVAAGIVPVAGASDGGGSIRIPAAYCGLFGLKPGRGVVPSGPRSGEPLFGAAVTGVLTRSVRDSAAFLDVMRGSDPSAPYEFAAPGRSYAESLSAQGRTLRIGVHTGSALNASPNPEVVAAVHAMRDLLTDMGHVVEDARPAVDEEQLARDFLTPWFVHVAAEVARHTRTGRPSRSDFELDTLVLAEIGRATSAVDYDAAIGRWHDHVRALGTFHQHYDLFLTPTTAEPAPLIGAFDTPFAERLGARAGLALRLGPVLGRLGVVQDAVMRSLSAVPYTQLANVTGRPAMSIPSAWTPEGLPVGVQFVAAPGGESTLLQLARDLEEARPWFATVPVI
ncbi:amidase [Rhodococcus sp. MEB064]|uniref:amidase n=1 Tax=Rhodococcus sp. MEB064 TaxID=1587522 RepID=UPI0005AC4BA0|nr:amidase family protein [Rhodococcus sp. MEB064]KIQ19872.1 amidase [Rhodococcus sp. MEB064]